MKTFSVNLHYHPTYTNSYYLIATKIVLNKLTLNHCHSQVSFSRNEIFKNSFWQGLIIVRVNNIEIITLNLRSSHNNILTGDIPYDYAFLLNCKFDRNLKT